MQGWLKNANSDEIELIGNYAGFESSEIAQAVLDGRLCRTLVRLAFSSVAEFAIIPMQDLFALDNEARMNLPSTTGGINWQWRMSFDNYSTNVSSWLKKMGMLYGRNLRE